MFITAFTTPR